MIKAEKKVNGIIMAVFSIVTIALIALRTLISKNYIEQGTGFYTGGDGLVLTFNIVLIAFTAAIIVCLLMRFRKRRLNVRPDGVMMGVVSLVMVGGFVYDVYSSMTTFLTSKACHHFISLFSSKNVETTNIVVDIFQGYMLLIGAVFAFISAIYFVLVATRCINRVGDYSRLGVLALAPLWWAVFRAVYFILVPMNFAKMSDLLYETIMVCFLLLFFSAFARVASKVDGENSVGKVIAYGCCAAVFAAISSVPRIIMMFMGIEGVTYTSPQDASEIIFKSEYCFMALAVFIFCTVFIFYALHKISVGKAYLEGAKEKMDLHELESEEDRRAQRQKELDAE